MNLEEIFSSGEPPGEFTKKLMKLMKVSCQRMFPQKPEFGQRSNRIFGGCYCLGFHKSSCPFSQNEADRINKQMEDWYAKYSPALPYSPGGPRKDCKKCNGSGYEFVETQQMWAVCSCYHMVPEYKEYCEYHINQKTCNRSEDAEEWQVCPDCKGTGKYIGLNTIEPCQSCQ